MLHWWTVANTAALQPREPDGLKENKYHFKKLASFWHTQPVANPFRIFEKVFHGLRWQGHKKPNVCTVGSILWSVMHHLTADWWSTDLLLLALWAILRLAKLWWSASTDTWVLKWIMTLWENNKKKQRQWASQMRGWEQDADSGRWGDGCPRIKDSLLIPPPIPSQPSISSSSSFTYFDRFYNAVVCERFICGLSTVSTHTALYSGRVSLKAEKKIVRLFPSWGSLKYETAEL